MGFAKQDKIFRYPSKNVFFICQRISHIWFNYLLNHLIIILYGLNPSTEITFQQLEQKIDHIDTEETRQNFSQNISITPSKRMFSAKLWRWEGMKMQGGREFQHLGAVALKDLLPMEDIVIKLVPEDLRVRQTEQECRDESNQRGSLNCLLYTTVD